MNIKHLTILTQIQIFAQIQILDLLLVFAAGFTDLLLVSLVGMIILVFFTWGCGRGGADGVVPLAVGAVGAVGAMMFKGTTGTITASSSSLIASKPSKAMASKSSVSSSLGLFSLELTNEIR